MLRKALEKCNLRLTARATIATASNSRAVHIFKNTPSGNGTSTTDSSGVRSPNYSPIRSHVRFLATKATPVENKPAKDLIITELCAQRLSEILKDGEYLRITVDSGGCSGFEYKFSFDTSQLADDDVVFAANPRNKDCDTNVVVDELSLDLLRGSTVDYKEELIGSRFKIVNNPIAEQGCSCGTSFAVKLD